MNTLFIQYYTRTSSGDFKGVLAVFNGFSDTYNFCVKKGDFLWVDINKVDELELPFKNGRVYVSVFFIDHLYSTYKLAKRYPDIEFICGGPVVQMYEYNLEEIVTSKIDIPNLKLTRKTVEEYFEIPEFSEKWSLNLDGIENIDSYSYLCYSYLVDSKCYWNKCIFCTYPKSMGRKRYNINLDVLDEVEFHGFKQIRLQIPSFNEAISNKLFTNFKTDKNIIYDVSLRCDPSIIKSIDSALDKLGSHLPKLKLKLGVEFPSNRMLKFMKKGITLNDVLEAVKMCRKYDSNFIMLYILLMSSWPNLNSSDLSDFDIFKDNITKPVELISLAPLYCAVGTEIHEMYKDQVDEYQYAGPFYKGYIPKLSEEVKMVDEYVYAALKNKCKRLYIIKSQYYESIKVDVQLDYMDKKILNEI